MIQVNFFSDESVLSGILYYFTFIWLQLISEHEMKKEKRKKHLTDSFFIFLPF